MVVYIAYLAPVRISRSLGKGQVDVRGNTNLVNMVLHFEGQYYKLGQGHLKAKVIPRLNCKCLTFCQQAGDGPLTERHSCSLQSTS